MKALSATLYVALALVVVFIFRRFFAGVHMLVVCLVAAILSYLLQPIFYHGIVGFLSGGSQDKTEEKPMHEYHGEKQCPNGHGPLKEWDGKLRCWKCGWPYK